MRRIHAIAIVLAVLIGAGATVAFVLDRESADPGGSAGDPAEARPEAGVTLVAGRAELLVLSAALLDPVPSPVTIEALDRGAASARISPVTVDGREQSVAWGGGTPLVIEGTGELLLDPAPVEVTTAGVRVGLQGVTAGLTPGPYVISGPVALGAQGLARPAERVSFEATDATVISFDGSAVLRLPTEPLTLDGPGEGRLVGDVELTSARADRRLSSFGFGPGPYRFDLVWLEDRIELDGRIEAEVRASRPPTSIEGSL